ncbi:hypothetical protein K491DRAFT_587149 [Lophiostoma macrostomum CBS 122681]|uniref:Integral membrane protein n=1 Tax=Lophiostoma macrostomum CBS 122681 TaxID=1314788 RepID=A0A6A6TNY7_9PLEO|nr:hypothetical protein K491DRAFT_587149 [Lophiostoma macrostomum CBS 122681]
MDKLRVKASSARNRVAEATSRGSGSASLAVPHSTLPPHDNSSTTAVNEGYMGPQPGTAAQDFAVPTGQPVHQPVLEPPTSLQSSVDAGQPVPVPGRRRGNSADASRLHVPAAGGRPRSNSARSQNAARRPGIGARQPSIGIRRMPSSQALRQAAVDPNASTTQLGRTQSGLQVLDETCALGEVPSNTSNGGASSDTQKEQPGRLRRASLAVQSALGLKKDNGKDKEGQPGTATEPERLVDGQGRQFNDNMVDVLDTLDPEVATLTSLTNVQNSLFIPNLGRFVNRRPTYTIRQAPSERQSFEDINRILEPVQETQTQRPPAFDRNQSTATLATVATIDSHLSESRFAVLPHGASLEGWSKDDKKELNDHVRHMLHSRRSKFKRSMRGFGQYVKRPLGFLVTLYATLITLFGLAWVLFLIGWISVGSRQIYIVNVIDNVLVALFAIVGDGLAPFRAVDTYHMIFIAHYHHFTWSRRKKEMLPELQDHNDLPATNAPISGPRARNEDDDPEKGNQWEFTVLTPKQQAKLEHHQAKYTSSHSFYKPHETETHYAFPLRLLIAIQVLLDCHSLFQIALGACTWGIYYKVRPFALTTVILCCSITCNATAGLLILIGDKRTRKKDVLERMNRQELTEEAMHLVEKKKEKESESEREDNEEGGQRSGSGRRSLDVFRRHGTGTGHHHGHAGSGMGTPVEKGSRENQSTYP